MRRTAAWYGSMLLMAIVGCVVATLCAQPAAGQAEKPVDLGGVREEHVMIPMRDGVKLSAYLYFPAGK